MKRITAALAGLVLFGLLAAGPATPAKADGGAIAIGVGAFLLADAVVGHRCDHDDWPFNIVSELAGHHHHHWWHRHCYRHKKHRHCKCHWHRSHHHHHK
jgi:hypothetical protein